MTVIVTTRRFAEAAADAVYKAVIHARDHRCQQDNSAQFTRIFAGHCTSAVMPAVVPPRAG
jgi:hypothetical protein